MKSTISRYVVSLLCSVVLLSQAVRGDEPAIHYDIFSDNATLTVWIDLAPFLGSREIDQMKEGVNVVVECRLALLTPRRLFGHRVVAEQWQALLLNRRPLTEDFLVTHLDSDSNQIGPFTSLAGLHRYLGDSIEINLIELDSLDATRIYLLDLQLSTIYLTDVNLSKPEGHRADRTESPLKYLFRQFLELTGYGREEYATRSRAFSLQEVPDGR